MLFRLQIIEMLGPTWLNVRFKLKVSNQMEKSQTKIKWKWMGRQIKNNVNFGKNEWKLNPGMRACGLVKTLSQKYYTNMSLMLCRNTGVVDVKLAKETHCIRWGLRSWSPLKVVAIQTIDIFIRLLSTVSRFSEWEHPFLARSKISHILTGLGPPGSKCVD